MLRTNSREAKKQLLILILGSLLLMALPFSLLLIPNVVLPLALGFSIGFAAALLPATVKNADRLIQVIQINQSTISDAKTDPDLELAIPQRRAIDEYIGGDDGRLHLSISLERELNGLGTLV